MIPCLGQGDELMCRQRIFLIAGPMIAGLIAGCGSAPVEEVDPFSARSRPVTAAPPPTAVPAGGTPSAAPRAVPTSTAGTGTPSSRTSSPAPVSTPQSSAPTAAPSEAGGEAVEWVVAEPGSHRDRAKKLREKQQEAEKSAAPDSEPKR